jgi:DNA-damage-inducible protein J
MSRTSTLSMRIEPEVKAGAARLFGSFGLTIADAVNVFLRQSLMRGGFPFDVALHWPNADTRAAMAETESLLHDPNAKSFNSMDELRVDLLSDDDD